MLRLETTADASRAQAAVRSHLKLIEGEMYELEACLSQSLSQSLCQGPASADGSRISAVDGPVASADAPDPMKMAQSVAADSRRYVFRVDDITHELVNASASQLTYRNPISAINEVDDEPFPDIVYLHHSVCGDGVCLEMEPEFLVGCACDHARCSLDSGCSCCREQIVQACQAKSRTQLPPPQVTTPKTWPGLT